MTVVCVDAGFLIGLYQESDQYHTKAIQIFVELFEPGVNQLLIPWPIGHYRQLSAADRVVRYMLADTRLRIDALITYNPADFRDTCIQYRKTLVS